MRRLPESALALAGVLGLALALRLPGLGRSLWIDELYTSHLFTGDTVVLLKTVYSDIHPPLYFVFVHFWNAIFGDSEVALRLPPLLSGLASIGLVYAIGRAWAGSATGLAAAFLLALSPVHIWYSQEARPYSTTLCLLLVTLLAYTRLVQGRGGRGWGWVYLAGLAGAAFTHYYMAVFVLAFPALALRTGAPQRRRIVRASAAVLVAVAAYLGAKAYFAGLPTSKDYLRSFGLAEAWNLPFRWFLTGNSFTPRDVTTASGVAALAALEALGVVAFARGLRRLIAVRAAAGAPGWQLPALFFALPAFLLALPVLGLPQTYIERSALPALPLFDLVLAAGLTEPARSRAGRFVARTWPVPFAAVLVAFWAHAGQWTVYKPHPDWRSAAHYLAGEVGRSDGRLALYTEYPSPTPLTYYDRRFQEVKNFERNDDKVTKLAAAAARLFGAEGFPGAMIQQHIRARLDEFEHRLARDERDLRIAIHKLRPSTPLAPGARTFYILVHGCTTPLVQGILDGPRLRVTDKRSWLALTIYKLQRDG